VDFQVIFSCSSESHVPVVCVEGTKSERCLGQRQSVEFRVGYLE